LPASVVDLVTGGAAPAVSGSSALLIGAVGLWLTVPTRQQLRRYQAWGERIARWQVCKCQHDPRLHGPRGCAYGYVCGCRRYRPAGLEIARLVLRRRLRWAASWIQHMKRWAR